MEQVVITRQGTPWMNMMVQKSTLISQSPPTWFFQGANGGANVTFTPGGDTIVSVLRVQEEEQQVEINENAEPESKGEETSTDSKRPALKARTKTEA